MKKIWKRGVCCECGKAARSKLSYFCESCFEQKLKKKVEAS